MTAAHRRRRPVAVPVALVLGLGALAGCGSAADGAASAPSAAPSRADGQPAAVAWPAAVPESGLAKGLVLPLEAYMSTYPEDVAISRGKLRLVSTCMARFGFQWKPAVEPGFMPPPNYDVSNMARRYGISDPAEAAKYGYHLPEQPAAAPPPQKTTEAEETVLYGRTGNRQHPGPPPKTYNSLPVPTGGCSGEAVRKVGADYDATLVSRLDLESLERSETQPEVQAALSRWSACMRQHGYRVTRPTDAPDAAGGTSGPVATSKEIAVATADVACKKKTNLIRIWFTADAAIQRGLLEEHQRELKDTRRKITAAVKAATAVTG